MCCQIGGENAISTLEQQTQKFVEVARQQAYESAKFCREELKLEENEKPQKLYDAFDILSSKKMSLDCKIGHSSETDQAVLKEIFEVCLHNFAV